MLHEITLTREELERKFGNARFDNILRTLRNKKIEYKKMGEGRALQLHFSSPLLLDILYL